MDQIKDLSILYCSDFVWCILLLLIYYQSEGINFFSTRPLNEDQSEISNFIASFWFYSERVS